MPAVDKIINIFMSYWNGVRIRTTGFIGKKKLVMHLLEPAGCKNKNYYAWMKPHEKKSIFYSLPPIVYVCNVVVWL